MKGCARCPKRNERRNVLASLLFYVRPLRPRRQPLLPKQRPNMPRAQHLLAALLHPPPKLRLKRAPRLRPKRYRDGLVRTANMASGFTI